MLLDLYAWLLLCVWELSCCVWELLGAELLGVWELLCVWVLLCVWELLGVWELSCWMCGS